MTATTLLLEDAARGLGTPSIVWWALKLTTFQGLPSLVGARISSPRDYLYIVPSPGPSPWGACLGGGLAR